MKRSIASLMAFSCLFALSPAWSASVEAEFSKKDTKVSEQTVNAKVEKKAESPATGDNLKPLLTMPRQFTFVPVEQIPVNASAALDEKRIISDDINHKIAAAYIPVRLTLENKSGKLLKIPMDGFYYLDVKGNKHPIPSDSEVFRHVKRNGVRRALAWSVPLGIVSFGMLLPVAAVISGVHTRVTNGSLQSDLRQAIFRGGHVAPDSSVNAYVFIPKSGPDPEKLIFGRLINAEDELETELVVTIKNLETLKHVSAK